MIKEGLLLTTFPASNCINLHALNEQLQHQCQLVEQSSLETLFLDANTQYLPPFSPFAKLECIVDSALVEQEIIYFQKRNVNNHDAVHAQLILLANRLLHRYDMGNADSEELRVHILKSLGISAEIALQKTEEIMQHNEELNSLARQMVA